jgi:hypothetical protein
MERVSWPVHRFYWAILDTSRLPPNSRGARRERLEFALERYVPVPLESIHAAFQKLDQDRVLACAVERGLIESEVDASACSLTPAGPPAFAPDADVSGLELLSGPFEPPVVSRARARNRIECAVMIVLVASAVSAGLARRAHWHDSRRQSAESIQAALIDEVLPGIDAARRTALQLTGELRRLERTRAGRPTDVPTIVPQLASMFECWPSDPPAQAESIIVTETSLTIIATLDSIADVATLAAAIDHVPGWTMAQPEVRSSEGRARATIRFQRDQEAR